MRAAALLLLLAAALVEEVLEEFLEGRAGRKLRHVPQARSLLGHVLRGRDVDDGRHQLVDQLGEALRRLARPGRLRCEEAERCNGRESGPSEIALKIS